MWKTVLFALVAVSVARCAWAQMSLTPRVIRIDRVTCQEVLSLPGEQRDRLLIYLNGYQDGKQQATIWDERLTGERIDRVVAQCKADPKTSVLRAFSAQWVK